MRIARRPALAVLALCLAAPAGDGAPAPAPAAARDALGWPSPTRESRPWTRWWWLGSAVDEAGLTRQLEAFAQAGLGGVEICPIYGVQGLEARDVAFLSPRWVALLGHALREARRLGLGVDLTTGTGWPFGGPGVAAGDASARLSLQTQAVVAGARLALAPGDGRVVAVVALSSDGARVDLGARVAPDGSSDWIAPAGEWQVYAARAQGPIQQVKRAAPGGEGHVLDPFSPEALGRYLVRFDTALAGLGDARPRAQFHDSFEYYGASFTPELFAAFRARRGYDLRLALPALHGDGPAAEAARVRADYRETLGELHLEYVRRWTAWSHAHGSLTRNQAHGGPSDLVELYAAADIPETEVFGRPDEKTQPRLKLAASAAHLAGRALASAEAFTWLGEHFQVSLAQAKLAADWLFVSGVNHLFFHGIPYSPAGAAWPGWQFYASVNFGPEGGLWRDLPAFDGYLQRVQSVLQAGEPGEDVLLYCSPRDAWHGGGGELVVQNPVPEAFDEAGRVLSSRGYAWDAVADRFLAEARVERGRARIGAGAYAAIVVPRTEHLAAAARDSLERLAREGVAVLFLDGPAGERVPAIDARLAAAGVAREAMVAAGVWFVRRRDGVGWSYFVVNRGPAAVAGWLPLGVPARAVARLDPRAAGRAGVVPLRSLAAGGTEIRLDLAPGESAVLRALGVAPAAAAAWPRFAPAAAAVPLAGPWSVRFVEGGPLLPSGFETSALGSWTAREDEDARRFAGTARYSIRFARPGGQATAWRLDLGAVAETARVRLNGRALGTLWCPPFSLVLEGLRPGLNTLELEVTNLAANRVRDLDRRGVPWKLFRDANVVGVDYKPLDASRWPLRDSGLLGPVTLVPLRRQDD